MRWIALAAVLVVAFMLLGEVVDAQKKRRKPKKSVDASSFYTGTTPTGNTKWIAESATTIYTVVDTSHLKFDRVPKYFCSVVVDGRHAYAGVNATLIQAYEKNVLADVVGKYTPSNANNAGFRVRLKYKPGVDKNLTEAHARLGGWRVRWAAITEPHTVLQDARVDVENEKYEGGIEEKPVGQSLAYVKMLERLVKEDTQMVKGILGIEYELPVSKRPKPKKPVEKKTKEEDKKEEKTKTDQEEKTTEGEEPAKEDEKATSEE